ncbi:uncharacterized protein J4E92_007099 [Alternaria infectoria]|uniref:uncharacterized protein n=1 Tax=Alternaria infectoria TaxID=45303 RepID=UPI00221F7205|nr:uncharacterized protein J4E92_007099 [Alternaria infectoria]KAI4925061.1 hypothetical protein J4E92_007099 [Alternaria infectoria]
MSSENKRPADEMTTLQAQFTAKSCHEQLYAHHRRAATAPATAGQPTRSEPAPYYQQSYIRHRSGCVCTLPSSHKQEEDESLEDEHETAEQFARNWNPTKFPKLKDWTNDDFRSAIQHWTFDRNKKNTSEAINEAEAALYDLDSGSWVGSQEWVREQHVSETVYVGLLKLLRRYGYWRHSITLRSKSWDGRKMTIYRTQGAEDLPLWLQCHGFEIEDDEIVPDEDGEDGDGEDGDGEDAQKLDHMVTEWLSHLEVTE